VGLLAAPALGSGFGSVLYGVPSIDPVSYAAAAIILFAIALLASFVPALSASRAAPSEALRAS
jgi:putative ABC transport system permease protein